MKLKRLSTAVIAATAVASSAYAQDVTVYGKVNVSLNQTNIEEENGTLLGMVGPYPVISYAKTDTQDNWELNSNASRVGVKGSVPINDSLKAIYKLEYEVYVDDGSDGSTSEFKQRNIYGGFQGNFGTVTAGKFDTPTKVAQGKIDRFNDLPLGDIKNVFEGENRESNIIQYASPTIAGFVLTAAFMPGEDSGAPGDDENDGLADHISASAAYKNGGLYAAIGIDKDVADLDLIRIVAEYDFGTFKLGGMVQQADWSSDREDAYAAANPLQSLDHEESGAFISGEMKIADTGLVVKAQYGFNNIDEDEDFFSAFGQRLYTDKFEDEITQFVLGVDYKLSKASKLYAYYSMVEADYDSRYSMYPLSGTIDFNETEDADTFGVGYEIKF